jgi:hypothetical protein
MTRPRGVRDPADLAIAGVDRVPVRLVDLLKGDDPGLALKVLEWLSEFGAAPAVTLLPRRFEQAGGDSRIRMRIVHALCAFGADPAVRMPAPKAPSRADHLEAAKELRSRATSKSEVDRPRPR